MAAADMVGILPTASVAEHSSAATHAADSLDQMICRDAAPPAPAKAAGQQQQNAGEQHAEERPSSAAEALTSTSLGLLEVPVMPPASHSSLCDGMLQQALQQCGAAAADDIIWSEGLQAPFSFEELVARDMQLEDDCLQLPITLFQDDVDQTESSEDAWKQAMVDCHCRPATAAHLELYLDWSLIRPGASQQQAKAADFVTSHPIAKAARTHAVPGPAAASKSRMADVSVPSLASVAAQQAAASKPKNTGDATPEVCPALVLEMLGIAHKDVQVQPGSAEQQPQVASVQHKRQASSSGLLPLAKRRLSSGVRTFAGQPDAATTATEAAPRRPSGVQAGRATVPMGYPAATNAAAEMAFFLQLNGSSKGTAPPPGQQQAEPAASMDSDDGMTSDEPQEVQVSLQDTHLRLLLQLQQAHDRAMSKIPELNQQVALSKLWEPSVVEELAARAQEECQQQQVVGYATLMVLRHCAVGLLHHGIRVAYLYAKAMAQKLPKVLPACQDAITALGAAQQQVDSGQMEDHPKHKRLQQLLMAMDVMHPGQPVLLVADSFAFFTLYKVITHAGFRAHQLDREGRLQQQQPGPGPAGQPAAAVGSTGAAVVEAVAKALDAANCILISKQQLCLSSFPLARFTCMVELCRLDLVETRPDLEDQVRQHFKGRRYIVDVEQPDMEAVARSLGRRQSGAGQRSGRGMSGTVAGIMHSPAKHKAPVTAIAAATAASSGAAAPPARPAHRASEQAQEAVAESHQHQRQHPPSAPERAATTNQQQQQQPEDLPHPLVISSRQGSVLQSRRALYEALLQLEHGDVLLAERPLQLVDVLLTPGSCLCLLAGQDLQQLQEKAEAAAGDARGSSSAARSSAVVTAVVQLILSRLPRLSYAFSTVFFLLEASDSLLVQVLQHSHVLQAAASRLGTRLQLLTSPTAAITQQLVVQVCKESASSYRAAAGWQALQISDAPCPREHFLCTLPMLNPLSAARLLCSGLTLKDLLALAAAGQLQGIAADVPAQCLQLFQAQAGAVIINISMSQDGIAPQHASTAPHMQQQQQQQQQQQHMHDHQQYGQYEQQALPAGMHQQHMSTGMMQQDQGFGPGQQSFEPLHNGYGYHQQSAGVHHQHQGQHQGQQRYMHQEQHAGTMYHQPEAMYQQQHADYAQPLVQEPDEELPDIILSQEDQPSGNEPVDHRATSHDDWGQASAAALPHGLEPGFARPEPGRPLQQQTRQQQVGAFGAGARQLHLSDSKRPSKRGRTDHYPGDGAAGGAGYGRSYKQHQQELFRTPARHGTALPPGPPAVQHSWQHGGAAAADDAWDAAGQARTGRQGQPTAKGAQQRGTAEPCAAGLDEFGNPDTLFQMDGILASGKEGRQGSRDARQRGQGTQQGGGKRARSQWDEDEGFGAEFEMDLDDLADHCLAHEQQQRTQQQGAAHSLGQAARAARSKAPAHNWAAGQQARLARPVVSAKMPASAAGGAAEDVLDAYLLNKQSARAGSAAGSVPPVHGGMHGMQQAVHRAGVKLGVDMVYSGVDDAQTARVRMRAVLMDPPKGGGGGRGRWRRK